MGSLLIVTSVENLENGIKSIVKTFGNVASIYVSLNKAHSAVEKFLKKAKVDTKKVFFVDCVSSGNACEEVIQVKPKDLGELTYTINTYINEIKEKKYILLDSLATLLIYNNENNVAKFVKKIIEYASHKDVEIIALSPKTGGEELLGKIYNFFDKVEKK